MPARTALLVLALLLLPAAGALAAVVQQEQEDCSKLGREFTCQTSFTLVAAPGEANRITLRQVEDRTELRDTGAPLTETGASCEPLPDGGVSCLNPIAVVRVEAGDDDDTVVVTGMVRPTVDGGPGDDVLTGGDGSDDLDGGPGADVVKGGAGDDQLTGGGGDTIDGGPGRDAVLYRGRRAPVRVDLAAGTAGADTITGIEEAEGGAGADTLLGDEGPNALTAGAGDVVDGRGGADALGTTGGPAVLLGGAGDDDVSAGEGSVRIDCGPGRDRVSGPSSTDVLARTCELVDGGVGYDVRLSRGAVAVRAPGGHPGVAVLRAVLAGRERVVGRRVLGLGAPREVHLNALGRALARRPGSVPLRLRAQERGRYARSGGFIAFRLRL